MLDLVVEMNTQSLRLDTIIFDAGTQIRAAISEDVVGQYAERMTEGDTFPAVVVFHDGNQYYMADGFHRGLAAKRNDFREIDADIRVGTKTDALWFALGANKTSGYRMTSADKKSAVDIAIQTWPEKSLRLIAEQVGCNHSYVQQRRDRLYSTIQRPDRVTGRDGRSFQSSRKDKPTPQEEPPKFKSRSAVQQRREQMRAMASEGHSSRQIAAAIGISEITCRVNLRKEGIDVPADRAVGKSRHHDANRIVGQMVMDAEHLTADVNLVEFISLDREQLGGWICSLIASRKALELFIRRLKQEHEKHGKAA